MTHTLTNKWGDVVACGTIAQIVSRRLEGSGSNGQLEEIQRAIERQAAAFGRLLELMVDRNTLSPDDVSNVIEGSDGYRLHVAP